MIMGERMELERAIGESGEIAIKLGLNPPAVNFEMVPADVMYEIAAYHFPARFPHWTHGGEYYRQKTQYDHGLSKIYELVVNTDPPQAYLMESNDLVAQKLVIAHVLGHADFFRRNIYFKDSNRHMDISARAHADLVRSLEEEQGVEAVERILDAALSIAYHVDPASSFFRRKGQAEYEQERLYPIEEPLSDYDDIWNLAGKKKEMVKKERRLPPEPQRDVVLFLAENSHQLEVWQRAILNLVREEWIYFYPNIRTKVMNEGYATFWHERILENSLLTPDEHLEFRRLHTGVVAVGHNFSINPYLVGYKLWRDIEKRWQVPEEERTWYGDVIKRKGGEGIKKVLDVAAEYRDADFVRGFMTEKLVQELDLYAYQFEGDASKEKGKWVVQQATWQKVRDGLADQLTSSGLPTILVEDGDYHRRGELLLTHDFKNDRTPIDLDYAARTLRHVYTMWGKPVHISTEVNNKKYILTCEDGVNVSSKIVS